MGCFHNIWNPVRDAVETAGTLAGNYFLPGSSLLTSHLVSKGAQDNLDSTIGRIANVASGLAGSGIGSSVTGIPSASSVGAGWENAANGVGNLVGAGNIGTNVSNGVSGLLDSATSGAKDILTGAGNAIGLNSGSSTGGGLFSNLFGSSAAPSSALTGGTAVNSATGLPLSGAGSTAFAAAQPSLSTALPAVTGGGGSSYGTIASLLGAANSLSANDKAQKDLLNAQTNSMNALQPFLSSGTANNAKLSDLLGTSGNTGASDYGSLTKPFTPTDLQNDPGYQFQLQQGNQALDRKAAAGGNYFSGSALKAAEDYGQGLADTTYNNAFARDQSAKQQQYGMYAGQSGQGQNAANAAGQIYGQTGTAKAAAGLSSANILNQTLSSLLNGSGAKKPVYNANNQIIGYA